MESHVQLSETGPFWTDEKHTNFLNSMEASFVRSMFENRTDHRQRQRRRPRLDRHLLDTADSTLNYSPQKDDRKNHAISYSGTSRIDGRSSRRSTRTSSLPHTSIQDQVVPHMESSAAEDEDERDHPMSPHN